jgi:hypothetical protein
MPGTCAAWRPDTDAFHDPVTAATRIATKSICCRVLHLYDEIGLFSGCFRYMSVRGPSDLGSSVSISDSSIAAAWRQMSC